MYALIDESNVQLTIPAADLELTQARAVITVRSAGRPLALELPALPQGGAAIFSEAVGHLPDLRGRLNPKLDALDRTYLYADNISINDGMQQPVHFLVGEDLRLTDAWGYELLVRIVDIAGRSALVEYRTAPERAGP